MKKWGEEEDKKAVSWDLWDWDDLFSQIGGGGRKRKRKQKGGNLSRFLSKKDKQRFRRRRAFEDKYLPDLLQKGAGFGRRKQKGGFFQCWHYLH